jgi:2-phospho-L-lactate guanylyltransferase
LTPRTTAILPVKRFERAKQRLEGMLDPGARSALAPAMLADVIAALERAQGLDHLLIVSGDSEAERLARGRRVSLVADPVERGQSSAAAAGMRRARELGFERVLLVPGDCPLADPAELDTLLVRAAEHRLDLVIVPDRHGEGTNALLLDPAGPFGPSFGPGSLARHVAEAERLGLRHAVEPVPSLVLDVDTPADLVALEAALARDRSVAPATRAALAELGHAGPPPVAA